jgi:hypothetical protein
MTADKHALKIQKIPATHTTAIDAVTKIAITAIGEEVAMKLKPESTSMTTVKMTTVDFLISPLLFSIATSTNIPMPIMARQTMITAIAAPSTQLMPIRKSRRPYNIKITLQLLKGLKSKNCSR